MRANCILQFEAARLANKVFNDREWTAFLTKAELEYVQVRVDKFKNRTQRGLGDSPIRAAELAGLVSSTKKIAKPYNINGSIYNTSATTSPFIQGGINNGSLRRPDLDANLNSNGEEPEDHFGIFVALPDEAMYIITERVDITKGTCQIFNIEVQEVTYDEYVKWIDNTFRKPGSDFIWGMDWGSFTIDELGDGTNNSIKYIADATSTVFWNGSANATVDININSNRTRHLIPGKGWDIVGYNVHYIVQPKGITVNVQAPSLQVNSILPNHTHQAIVDIAVRLASAAVVPEQSKYQVNQIESKEDE
jgi:hypothetical protein